MSPIINPPSDDNIVTESDISNKDTTLRDEWIKERISKPPWKCTICGLVNFHYNEKCGYCWIRNGIITLKPNESK